MTKDLRTTLGTLVAIVSAASLGCDDVPFFDESGPRCVDKRFDAHVTVDIACNLVAMPSARRYSLGDGYESVDYTLCATACGSLIDTCSIPESWAQAAEDAGPSACESRLAASEPTPTVRCETRCPIAGRRPTGYEPGPISEDTLGASLAQAAELEAASVIAFEQLARRLAAFGAPTELVKRCRESADEERRHYETVAALAARAGCASRPDAIEAGEATSFEDLARENLIEGVVRETFGALVALWQGRHAEDEAIRNAYARIAEDEVRHAELSVDIDAWCRTKLPATGERLEHVKKHAIDDLRIALERQLPRSFDRALGTPTPEASLALFVLLNEVVWSQSAA